MTFPRRWALLQNYHGRGNFRNNRYLCSKSRVDTQFVHRLNQDTDIMAQNLTQDLIDLGNRRLGTDKAAELGLDHRKSSFHVAALVIMGKKGRAVEVVEVPHPLPEAIEFMGFPHTVRVRTERDVGSPAHCLYRPNASPGRVGLVSSDFVDRKRLGCFSYKPRKLFHICRLRRGSFNSSDDVRLDADHDMGLHPSLPLPLLSPFVVKPAVVDRCSKARGIRRKVHLNSPHGHSTLLNQGLEQRRQFGLLQVPECAGKGWLLVQKALRLSVPQRRYNPPTGHRRIRLERQSKHHIRQGQTGPSKGLRRLLDTVTEVTKQCHEVFKLVSLRGVVRCPILDMGGLRFRSESSTISRRHDGANNSVVIRGRRRYSTVRPRFGYIVSNIAKKVKLNRSFSASLTFEFWRYSHISGSVSNYSVTYECSVANSVTEHSRMVPRAGFEPAWRKTAGGFQDRCVYRFHHLGIDRGRAHRFLARFLGAPPLIKMASPRRTQRCCGLSS